MLIVFLGPAEFPIIDVMSQDTAFTAGYFIAQVLMPLHQHRTPLSQDVARPRRNLLLILHDAIPLALSLMNSPNCDAGWKRILLIPLMQQSATFFVLRLKG
jgi:hypothetical protein